jgi:hypothetical protein
MTRTHSIYIKIFVIITLKNLVFEPNLRYNRHQLLVHNFYLDRNVSGVNSLRGKKIIRERSLIASPDRDVLPYPFSCRRKVGAEISRNY